MFEARKICILLAAYNGEKYLSEQIKSIQGQTISNWTLLIRDDGSHDHTRTILEKFAADPRIRLLDDKLGRLGATRNFGALMESARSEGAETIFFCDQDDVWLPEKMFRQLQLLHDLESRHGTEMPLLTYSDMEVVDENLRRIHRSFMLYQGQRHEPMNPIYVLLTQNFVAGCTMAINRHLLEFAVPIPEDITLHDWWLAVCAAACGRIGYIDQPLVRYRQHGTNQVGAVTTPKVVNFLAAAYRKRLSKPQYFALRPIRQAAALSERLKMLKVDCSFDVRRVVDALASSGEVGVLRRFWTVYRLPLRRQGFCRNLLWLARLVCSRKPRKAKTAFAANRSVRASK
ncbi:MAG TPA: glycosyltransferase family 2 protein [Candidatus Saccharimonadales bacterium]|nr:glycosyltransferase family 2 protein [Candidatus Saccharimonadales bacterium]